MRAGLRLHISIDAIDPHNCTCGQHRHRYITREPLLVHWLSNRTYRERKYRNKIKPSSKRHRNVPKQSSQESGMTFMRRCNSSKGFSFTDTLPSERSLLLYHALTGKSVNYKGLTRAHGTCCVAPTRQPSRQKPMLFTRKPSVRAWYSTAMLINHFCHNWRFFASQHGVQLRYRWTILFVVSTPPARSQHSTTIS